MARVALEGVSKVFPNGVAAVERLDLEIRDREFLVLVGPSGCGKTTTLRMIAGLEEATTGDIRIGERVVNHVAPKDRNIAMVFQNYALYPHMTVYRNMSFGLELRYGGGWLSRLRRRLAHPAEAAALAQQRCGIRQQVQQAARTLNIEHLLDRMPRQLSGGERQRVALGRAIVRQPAAFLFDEPLSNLDAKLRVDMRRELKRLHKQLQGTMIFVTHDQVEALTLGDRIVVMDRGAVQQIGTPMEVYDRPRNRFVAGFIGAPAMNFWEGKLQAVEGGVRFLGFGLTVPISAKRFQGPAAHAVRRCTQGGEAVVLGARPEDLRPQMLGPSSSSCDEKFRVSVVEALGDSAVLHLEVAEPSGLGKNFENLLLCRTDARTALRAGDVVSLSLDPARAHLFDPRTGENLTLAEDP
jgi:multiple sugar transport system ATP-binding protein